MEFPRDLAQECAQWCKLGSGDVRNPGRRGVGLPLPLAQAPQWFRTGADEVVGPRVTSDQWGSGSGGHHVQLHRQGARGEDPLQDRLPVRQWLCQCEASDGMPLQWTISVYSSVHTNSFFSV